MNTAEFYRLQDDQEPRRYRGSRDQFLGQGGSKWTFRTEEFLGRAIRGRSTRLTSTA